MNRVPVIAEVRLLPDASPRPQPGRWSEEAGDVPAGGLPGRGLRALRLKDPIELFPKILQNLRRRLGPAAATRVLDRFATSATAGVMPRRPGRAGRPVEFYALWAAAYVERLQAGSRHPVKELAEDPPIRTEGPSRKHPVSQNTIRDILHEARERGLLTTASAGRPGGELTSESERLLRKLKPEA